MSPPNARSALSWPSTVELAKDTWVFESQWGVRPDDLSSCTERLLTCLTGVASLDPSLAHWFHGAEPVALDAASLRDRLDQGWDREDPAGEIGSVVALWNGVEDDLAVAKITVSCGSTAPYLKNFIKFVLPRPAAAPGLYHVETMLKLFETMISAWQPQWCRVRSWSLRDATYHESFDVIASSIAYLDRGLYERTGALPNEVRVIERSSGGKCSSLHPPRKSSGWKRSTGSASTSRSLTNGVCSARAKPYSYGCL